MTRPVLACRLDNLGDVMLTGPAVRAIAARSPVVMLTSTSAAAVARLLPGISGVYEFDAGSGWVSVGTYPSLGMAALVLDRLKAGTHAYVRPYGTGGEPIPGQVVPFPDATAILAERGFCDAPPAP